MPLCSLLSLPENVLHTVFDHLSPFPRTFSPAHFAPSYPAPSAATLAALPAFALALSHPTLYSFYHSTYVLYLALDARVLHERKLIPVLTYFLPRLPALKTLDLAHFLVNDDDRFNLPSYIADAAARLGVLCLRGTDFSPEALLALLSVFPGLTCLDISQATLVVGGEVIVGKSLPEIVGSCDGLRVLEMKCSQWCMKSLDGLLTLRQSLLVLRLTMQPYNEKVDMSALGEMKALQLLEVKDWCNERWSAGGEEENYFDGAGHFGDEVASKVFERLGEFNELKVLILVGCGALSSVSAWKVPESVEELYLETSAGCRSGLLGNLSGMVGCLDRLHNLRDLKVAGHCGWFDENSFSPDFSARLEVLELVGVSRKGDGRAPLTTGRIGGMVRLERLCISVDWIEDSLGLTMLALPHLTSIVIGKKGKLTAAFLRAVLFRLASVELPSLQMVRLPQCFNYSADHEVRSAMQKLQNYSAVGVVQTV